MTTLDLANELAVDDNITEQAINYAEKILDFCEKILNDMVAYFAI